MLMPVAEAVAEQLSSLLRHAAALLIRVSCICQGLVTHVVLTHLP
jgi:hypothetical protein